MVVRAKVPLSELASGYRFPDASKGAGPLGVVGVGSDLRPGTILTAYHRGIFPWPAPEYGKDVILWCSPDPRALFALDKPPHWSRSLTRSLRKKPFRVTVDTAFLDVVKGCGDRREGTWITEPYLAAYKKIFEAGWAHSLEVWNTESGKLVGGIYGVAIGAAFAAESMFHRETDASKVAFASLVEHLRPTFDIFDAQIMNPHLASLGCFPIPRAEYLRRLGLAAVKPVDFPSSFAAAPAS